MSASPIDVVLGRLDGFQVRENGRDRWRACCPAHGGSNPSTLSLGVGDNGTVLLRCWSGCSLEDITAALGLNVMDLFPPKSERSGGGSSIKRRRLLTARQALDVLNTEMTLAVVCMSDMARGKALDEATRERLLLGAARVSMLDDEVRA